MPAIIDASCMAIVVGEDRTPAISEFVIWVTADDRNGCIVFGGSKYRTEMYKVERFKIWAEQLLLAGKAVVVDDKQVDLEEAALIENDDARSDDPHIIALALVSQARLLVSDDNKLKRDFTNVRLLRKPKGKLYPWEGNRPVTDTHRNLLRRHACKQRK